MGRSVDTPTPARTVTTSFAERLHLTDYWREFGPPDACELRDGRIVC